MALSTKGSLGLKFAIAFMLISFAGTLRFYRLGDWPFAGDETATLSEERSLFAGGDLSGDDQTYRLARVIPLSYVFQHTSMTLFIATSLAAE